VAVDAVVVGGGHNGLVAATLLARAGWSVEVHERREVAGGAVGSVTTARGYVHDWGSAFFGVLHTSPVLRELALDRRVVWAHTPVPVAATWDTRRPAALLRRTPDATAADLGTDARAWLELCRWWDRRGGPLLGALMSPLPLPLRWLARSGVRGALQDVRTMLEPVEAWAAQAFGADEARMLVTAHATHADVAVDASGSTPPALLLTMAAQTHGMPVPVGGADRLAAAFVQAAEEAGVVVRTGVDVARVVVRHGRAVGVEATDGTGTAVRRAVLADVAPGVLARDLVGEQHLPAAWLASLRRHRYGSGYFRLDVDLSGPAPWRDQRLRDALVVHVTGDVDELADAQSEVRRSRLPARPQLIVGQQDRADPSRVPPGAASLWVECHCPARPVADAADELPADWRAGFAERVLDRLAAHAPGLLELVVETTVTTPLDLQARDPNLVGGDVAGGSAALDQQLVLRPVAGWSPYALPVRGLWMCGAASHPGGGVHGMVGRAAARAVLRTERLRRLTSGEGAGSG